MERVEDRILLSVANMNPLASVAVASPPAAPSVAAVVSYVEAKMDQVVAAEKQAVRTIVEIIAQEQAFLIQEVDHLFGIPSPSNPTISTTAQQSGSGAASIRSGSGSGSGATPSRPIVPKPGEPKAHPPSKGSGIGFAADPGSGSGTATVSGQVWLDNNGDRLQGYNEDGLPGVKVNLINTSTKGVQSTTTDTNGNYKFTFTPPPAPGNEFQIQVILPGYDYATIEGYDSEINAQGYSAVFALAPGGNEDIPGGIRSMNVTTLQDDPNGAIPLKITLRDAIETGNNGPPSNAVTFYTDPQGDQLSGTIALQTVLPAIEKSYSIFGPGASTLTVKGDGVDSVFEVDTNVQSAINYLTITGGGGASGGGIYNLGYLTVSLDIITGNTVTIIGGGILNADGAVLTLENSAINNNIANIAGGGIGNAGKLNIIHGSDIYSNQAYNGGGLANSTTGESYMYGAAIYSNQASNDGGGIYNSGSISMTGWGSSGKIKGNQATNAGGGIYSTGGIITLKNGVTISKNTAESGGGIYMKSLSVNMSGGGISSNQATVSGGNSGGGGVYVGNVGILTLTGGVSIFYNKVSGGNGAGIYIDKAGTVNVSGGSFQFNTAQSGWNGGAIYNAAGNLTLQGGAYVGPENSATEGGGIYLADPSITTFNVVTVSGNTASNGGAGVYQQTDATIRQPINLTDKDDPNGKPVKGP